MDLRTKEFMEKLKVIIIDFGKILLSIIYFFHKKAATEEKVAFISRQSDVPSEDILMVVSQLEKRHHIKSVLLTKTLKPGIFNSISYLFHMIGPQMRALATSKIVVLDGYCISVSILKHKPGLVVIQMWHAMGAMKKFGGSILGKEEGYSKAFAKAMNVHKNYDYIFVSSEICKEHLEGAYLTQKDKMIVMPLPRVDKIKRLTEDSEERTKMRNRIFEEYPQLSQKKNILYSPTFVKIQNGAIDYIAEIIAQTDYSKYNLIIVPHPLSRMAIKSEKAIITKKFPSLEMLAVADYVISDYSAFIFESAVAGKPIFIYRPNVNQYDDARGFYIDVKEEDFCVVSENSREVMSAIENGQYDLKKIQQFASKYIEINGNCAENIADFISRKM